MGSSVGSSRLDVDLLQHWAESSMHSRTTRLEETHRIPRCRTVHASTHGLDVLGDKHWVARLRQWLHGNISAIVSQRARNGNET
jgi:hypothetical protein